MGVFFLRTRQAEACTCLHVCVCRACLSLISVFIHSEAMLSIICLPWWPFSSPHKSQCSWQQPDPSIFSSPAHTACFFISSYTIYPHYKKITSPLILLWPLSLSLCRRFSIKIWYGWIQTDGESAFCFINISSQIYVSKRNFVFFTQREGERGEEEG